MTTLPEQRGKTPTSQEEDSHLYAEQVRLLYKNALVGLIASVINSAVLVFILRNVILHLTLILWFVCIILISTARLVHLNRFQRLPRELSDLSRWRRWFILGLSLSGITWGSAGVFLFPVESIVHQAFLVLVLGGMTIGAAGAFSVVMPAYVAYTLPSLAPLIFRFLVFGDEIHLAMGGMSLLFFVLITVIALRINRVTIMSLRLRFENSSLISYLSSAKHQLEELNKELSTEIEERKRAEEELKGHREHLEELVDSRTAEVTAANAKLLHEISERAKLQGLLSQGKREWEETFDSINDAITIHDRDFNIIRANKAAEKVLGVPFLQILGQKCYRLYHDSDSPPKECASCMVMKTGNPSMVELFEPHLDKYIEIKAFPLLEDGQVTRVVHVIRDITERKRTEAEVLKARKLESIGVLAGGIAHDFNNLLQAIMGNISLAKMLANPKEKTFPLLDEAEKASEQARELSYRLLTFSKGGDPVRRATSVQDLLTESISLSLSGSNVGCELCLPKELDLVEADKGQMNQVFNNLLINAKEAMPDGGTVKISAANIKVTGSANLPLKEGNFVKVSLADHGTGIPEKYLPRIFDPYFSTKDRGSEKGMGLGLAICHSITAKHEGHIGVESREGVGTVFHIYLPATDRKHEEGHEKGDYSAPGKGRVLVMDDEEDHRGDV